MHLGAARPDVVGHRQAALERRGRRRPAQALEQRLGLAVGDRRRRDPRQVGRVVRRQPLRARHGRLARSERVARVVEDVLDRPALDRVRRAPRAVGIHGTLLEAVVRGVGVDQHSLGATDLGLLRLDAAERAAVADEHDLAGDADAELVELRVVLREPVVGVHHVCRHVAGRRERVVALDDVVEVLLPREAVLLGGELPRVRLGHRHAHVERSRRVHAVGARRDVEPVRAQPLHGVLERLPRPVRADQLRLAAERPTRGLDGLRIDAVLITALVRALLLRMRVGEAEDRVLGQGGCGARTECERAEDGNAERPSRRRSAHWDLPCFPWPPASPVRRAASVRAYPTYADGTTHVSFAATQLKIRPAPSYTLGGPARAASR